MMSPISPPIVSDITHSASQINLEAYGSKPNNRYGRNLMSANYKSQRPSTSTAINLMQLNKSVKNLNIERPKKYRNRSKVNQSANEITCSEHSIGRI